MKTYRQREKQGSKVQESTKGPDEAKIKVMQSYGSVSVHMLWTGLCSSATQLMFSWLCFTGSLGADRIHLGCHHRTEKIWWSTTWGCVQRITTRHWNRGTYVKIISCIKTCLSLQAAAFFKTFLFTVLEFIVYYCDASTFSFFFNRCLLEKSLGICMKTSWSHSLSLLVPSGTSG